MGGKQRVVLATQGGGNSGGQPTKDGALGDIVIPSIFVMLLLSYLAVAHIDVPAVAAACTLRKRLLSPSLPSGTGAPPSQTR